GNVVRVASNDPMEQVGQVLEETGVRPDPDLFLSRCLVCNVPVEEGHVETVAQRVPAAVLDLKEIFHECPRCGRVYWEGTHAARIKRRLNAGGIPLG
ncbi:MAG: hypothetical protein FJY85_15435, partial [Deltaproteobacteria bacterium]|nr:hypothetical protein [Deltaproteobacteria bacterium]